MYVCMYACIYIRISLRMYTQTHPHPHTHTHTHTNTPQHTWDQTASRRPFASLEHVHTRLAVTGMMHGVWVPAKCVCVCVCVCDMYVCKYTKVKQTNMKIYYTKYRNVHSKKILTAFPSQRAERGGLACVLRVD